MFQEAIALMKLASTRLWFIALDTITFLYTHTHTHTHIHTHTQVSVNLNVFVSDGIKEFCLLIPTKTDNDFVLNSIIHSHAQI